MSRYQGEATVELELGPIERFTWRKTGETIEGRWGYFGGDASLVTVCGLRFDEGELLQSQADHRVYTVQPPGTSCVYKNNEPFINFTPTDAPQSADSEEQAKVKPVDSSTEPTMRNPTTCPHHNQAHDCRGGWRCLDCGTKGPI